MMWDLFCRVIDNHGDLGVCWRLAADLAGRGERVRLWVDDAGALAWMAPQGSAGVTVLPWDADVVAPEPGEVVVEAFGCELPPAFVERMVAAAATRGRPPVWINLEYLSAEPYVGRCHGLPSPQRSGLTKWFFYPGFTAATGGLLREPDLAARQAAFDAAAWLAVRGLHRDPGERLVSLFCYANPGLDALLDALADRPTLLLATPGHAERQVDAALGASLRRGALRAVVLPWLTQTDYDHLLWACELNVVRGEDSFVRAQWAGRPFVWQIYPQHDEAHLVKLEAFLGRFLATAEPELAAGCAAWWRFWNGAGAAPSALPPLGPWQVHCGAWRDRIAALPDLATQLTGFVAERR